MREFAELSAGELTAAKLRDELEQRGYALIRGLIPRAAIHPVLAAVTHVLASAGWLQKGHDPTERFTFPEAACGDPDPRFKQVYQRVFNLESFHALPHQPALRSAMHMLAGEYVLVHPKPIGRLIFPDCDRLVTHAHQDYEFMGGDPECYTAWIPLHNCPLEIGPLSILEGSHRYGVQQHASENLHVPEIPLDAVLGDEWVGGHVNAGDVLIFHSLTVHAASRNRTNQMRLSLDCRFQDAQRALNPSNLVFAGESGKSWDKTYAEWKSDDLKFYWRRIPLLLDPSRDDLAHLAETADSPRVQARYSRMVSQLD